MNNKEQYFPLNIVIQDNVYKNRLERFKLTARMFMVRNGVGAYLSFHKIS